MENYWEEKFLGLDTIWGMEPSDSAIIANVFFKENNVKSVLIPGIGYGRNAKLFCDSGINVTGIEISKSAIEILKQNLALDIKLHCGSVTEMPFDDERYDAVFCYALIHLLNRSERKEFLRQCYDQLNAGGYMFFTVISHQSDMFGKGKVLSENRYALDKGLNVYFYDEEAIQKEFSEFGLFAYREIDEPIKFMENEPALKCYWIQCQKK